MSAEHEELIIDRVSDVEDADDQLLAEDKVEEKETADTSPARNNWTPPSFISTKSVSLLS